MYEVCKSGDIESMKKLLQPTGYETPKINCSLFINAIQSGNLDMVKYIYSFEWDYNNDNQSVLFRNIEQPDNSLNFKRWIEPSRQATMVESIPILQFLKDEGFSLHSKCLTYAVIRNNIPMIQWALNNECPVGGVNIQSLESYICENGKIDILDLVWNAHPHLFNNPALYLDAFMAYNYNVFISWLQRKKCPGFLDFIRLLRVNDVTNERISYYIRNIPDYKTRRLDIISNYDLNNL